MAHASPKKQNPYVGPGSLNADQTIFGRDTEVWQVASRLINERTLLLYSPSGSGKSSLLQARNGVCAALAAQGFTVLWPLRASLELGGEPLPGRSANRYLRSIARSIVAAFAQFASADSSRENGNRALPPWLADRIARWGEPDAARLIREAAGQTRILMVFDQFEEVLTNDPDASAAKREFFYELGDTLRQEPRLFALFSIREEYIAALDSYIHILPDLSKRFRLAPLEDRSACLAIDEPARLGTPPMYYAPDALVHWVERLRTYAPPRGSALAMTGIDAGLMQMLCSELWERQYSRWLKASPLTARRAIVEITRSDIDNYLAEHRQQFADRIRLGSAAMDPDVITLQYYSKLLRQAAALTSGRQASRDKVREKLHQTLFQFLLTANKQQRRPYLRDDLLKAGIEPSVLVELERVRILQSLGLPGAAYIELAHDRFIAAVRTYDRELQEEADRAKTLRRSFVVGGALSLPPLLLLVLVSIAHFFEVHEIAMAPPTLPLPSPAKVEVTPPILPLSAKELSMLEEQLEEQLENQRHLTQKLSVALDAQLDARKHLGQKLLQEKSLTKVLTSLCAEEFRFHHPPENGASKEPAGKTLKKTTPP